MGDEPARPNLANLASRVRIGTQRGRAHANVRPYDRSVKFISLKKCRDLRTVVKSRRPLGG